jgi:hypothetical protein
MIIEYQDVPASAIAIAIAIAVTTDAIHYPLPTAVATAVVCSPPPIRPLTTKLGD